MFVIQCFKNHSTGTFLWLKIPIHSMIDFEIWRTAVQNRIKIQWQNFESLANKCTVSIKPWLSVLLGKISKVLYQTYHILGKIIAPYARNTVHLTGTIEYKCVCF